MAVEEDLGQGDTTSELFFKDDVIEKANVISREEIVVSGMDIVREILSCYDKRLKLKVLIDDGRSAHVGSRLATIEGPLTSMLSAERVALNFLPKDYAGLADPGEVRSSLWRRT
jgi:nicotinate-nucleotide pyrophosphorylase (carboxylating)